MTDKNKSSLDTEKDESESTDKKLLGSNTEESESNDKKLSQLSTDKLDSNDSDKIKDVISMFLYCVMKYFQL